MQNNILYGDIWFLKAMKSTSFSSNHEAFNLHLSLFISNVPTSTFNSATANSSKAIGVIKNITKFT